MVVEQRVHYSLSMECVVLGYHDPATTPPRHGWAGAGEGIRDPIAS